MFTRSVRKTLVLNTICTVCITQAVYYIRLLCVKYGMHAYAGRAYICRMYAPSMLFPPTQNQHQPWVWCAIVFTDDQHRVWAAIYN